jgi:hypothetical protein
MKRKINTIRASAQSGHHSFASITVSAGKRLSLEFVIISGVIIAKASRTRPLSCSSKSKAIGLLIIFLTWPQNLK